MPGFRVHLECKVLLVQRDQVEILELREQLVPQVHQDVEVEGMRETLELLEQLAFQVQQETLELLVSLELLELRVPLELQVKLVQLDLLAQLAPLEVLDQVEQLVPLVRQVHLEPLVLQVPPVWLEQQELKDLLDSQASLDPQVLKELKVQLDQRVSQVQQAR